ncbi:MAG TPA: hypothetical protein VJU18_17190 [Vicinamibacteria bacterium]|nr:hypothetical protein [Vicinamibacteria bacterium]
MRAGCLAVSIVLLVLLVLAAGFFLLVLLRDIDFASREPGPEPPPAPSPRTRPSATPRPSPSVPPDRYAEWVGSLNRFERRDGGTHHELRYGFLDHHGRRQEVTCRIAKADHQRETTSFGYSKPELEAHADAVLQDWIDGELARRGLAPYVHATVAGGYRWQSRFPALDADALGQLYVEIERFRSWLQDGYDRKRAEVQDAYLRERGFLLEDNTIGIDYARVVSRAERPIDDCRRALAVAATEDSERQRLGVFIAFLQELRYEVPRNPAGREIGGLYPPTEVLVNDHGDCDSKSATFAALWRNHASAVLLIEAPGHMLVGVETRPAPGLKSVRIGNRYFVLCEVAGPGKSHPGAKGISGQFQYWLLEPVGEAPQAIRGRSSP